MRWLVAMSILVASTPRADACSCAPPAVEVMPHGAGAPLNARVRVVVPGGDWLQAAGGDIRQVAVTLRPKRGTTKTIVEGKGKKKKRRTVHVPAPATPADRLDLGAGELRVIELAPREELTPKTAYVVTLAVPGGRDEVVGEFETGDSADTTIPSWSGVTKASYARETGGSTCTTADSYARLAVPDAEEGMLFGVWVGGEDGKVRYEDPPLTYVSARNAEIKLGRWSRCRPANFTFPTGTDKLVVGLRAYDLAGNVAETAGEVVLDLIKVKAP